MGLFFLESLIYRNPQWEKLFIFHRVRLNESWHLIYHSCGGHKSGLPLNWEVENWEEKEKKFEAETPTHKTWKVKFSTMASTTTVRRNCFSHQYKDQLTFRTQKLPNLTKKSVMKTLKNQALENVQYFDKVSQNRCDDPNSEVNMTNWLQNIIDDKYTVCKNAQNV